MAYRHRSEVTVKYGRLGDYSQWSRLQPCGGQRGWSSITVLSPITGEQPGGLEICNADLGEFERTLSRFAATRRPGRSGTEPPTSSWRIQPSSNC